MGTEVLEKTKQAGSWAGGVCGLRALLLAHGGQGRRLWGVLGSEMASAKALRLDVK